MKVLGALMLFLGALAAGLCAAARLRGRARQLRELERTMALAGYAIGRFRLSTPALAGELARSAPGMGAVLFARLAAALETQGERSLEELWQEAANGADCAAQPCLLAFGAVLGRYGAEEQARAAEHCRQELDALAAQAAENAARSGRVYVALAAAAGAAAAIVML